MDTDVPLRLKLAAIIPESRERLDAARAERSRRAERTVAEYLYDLVASALIAIHRDPDDSVNGVVLITNLMTSRVRTLFDKLIRDNGLQWRQNYLSKIPKPSGQPYLGHTDVPKPIEAIRVLCPPETTEVFTVGVDDPALASRWWLECETWCLAQNPIYKFG